MRIYELMSALTCLYYGTNERYREKHGEVRWRMKLRSLVTKVMLCTYIDICLCIVDS